NRNLSSFVVSNDNKSALSDEQLIYADGIQSQSLILSAMSVNYIPKTNVTLLNYVFNPGVYYDVTIKLKSSIPDGYLIENVFWARGNLILENGSYQPASNQGKNGDYWYRTTDDKFILTPLDTTNVPANPSGTTTVDLCKLVSGDWRLPTQAEVNALFEIWKNNSYRSGSYTDAVTGIKYKGVYYGTKNQPTVIDQDKYRFLPYAEAWNTDTKADKYQSPKNAVGYYWSAPSRMSFQFSNRNSEYFTPDNHGGYDVKRANTI